VTPDSKEPEVAEETPAVKSKLTIVAILAMLIGVLLTVMVAGVLFHYQRSKALQAEVLATSDQLKEKSLALDEMKVQIEVLSRQMHALKEYSIARSGSSSEKNKKSESPAPALDATENASPLPEAKETANAPVLPSPSPPKAKKAKAKPDGQNCELVGKSPEEQAATLQRCVNLMDTPPPKEKPRSR
jgi:cell division protein FtsL